MPTRPALLILALLALPLGTGCSGSTRSRPGLTPMGELPPAYRELWAAWLERAPDWPERRAACREDPSATTFLVENLAATFLRAYARGEVASLTDPGLGLFERARAELVLFGADSVPTLMELHAIGDGATAHLTGEVLLTIGAASIPEALARLDRPEAQTRRRVVSLLGLLPHARKGEAAVREALIARLATDSDWLVRRGAVGSLARRGRNDTTTQPARAALIRALGDPDPAVSVAAAAGLATLEDPQAVPALIAYLRWAQATSALDAYRVAQESLAALTGSKGRRSAKEWEVLWRQSDSQGRADVKKPKAQGR